MEYWGIIILLVGCWSAQLLLSMKQSKHYQASLNEVKHHKQGHVGVGITRAKFNLGKGIIMIVVTDIDGTIIDFREMKGATIFSRFKANHKALGVSVKGLANTLTKKRELQAFKQAVELINKERTKNKLSLLEI